MRTADDFSECAQQPPSPISLAENGSVLAMRIGAMNGISNVSAHVRHNVLNIRNERVEYCSHISVNSMGLPISSDCYDDDV